MKRIKEANISAIEFDLSKIDKEINKDLLRNMLLSGDGTSWLNNEKINKLIYSEVANMDNFFKSKMQQQQKIFQKYRGNPKRYKIYTLNSDMCIFNPPCMSGYIFNYNGSKVKSIYSCEVCNFFVSFDKKTEEGFDGFPQEIITYLWCCHK